MSFTRSQLPPSTPNASENVLVAPLNANIHLHPTMKWPSRHHHCFALAKTTQPIVFVPLFTLTSPTIPSLSPCTNGAYASLVVALELSHLDHELTRPSTRSLAPPPVALSSRVISHLRESMGRQLLFPFRLDFLAIKFVRTGVHTPWLRHTIYCFNSTVKAIRFRLPLPSHSHSAFRSQLGRSGILSHRKSDPSHLPSRHSELQARSMDLVRTIFYHRRNRICGCLFAAFSSDRWGTPLSIGHSLPRTNPRTGPRHAVPSYFIPFRFVPKLSIQLRCFRAWWRAKCNCQSTQLPSLKTIVLFVD